MAVSGGFVVRLMVVSGGFVIAGLMVVSDGFIIAGRAGGSAGPLHVCTSRNTEGPDDTGAQGGDHEARQVLRHRSVAPPGIIHAISDALKRGESKAMP